MVPFHFARSCRHLALAIILMPLFGQQIHASAAPFKNAVKTFQEYQKNLNQARSTRNIKQITQLYTYFEEKMISWIQAVDMTQGQKAKFISSLNTLKLHPVLMPDLAMTLSALLEISLTSLDSKDKNDHSKIVLNSFYTTANELIEAHVPEFDQTKVLIAMRDFLTSSEHLAELTYFSKIKRFARWILPKIGRNLPLIISASLLLGWAYHDLQAAKRKQAEKEELNEATKELLKDFGGSVPTMSSLYEVVYPVEGRTTKKVILSDAVQKEVDLFMRKIKKPGRRGQKGTTGLILSGPTGSGKTMLSQAIASELDRPLVVVTAANLMSKFVGQTSENINAIFEVARRIDNNPILFIDEIDSIISKRVDEQSTDKERANATNTFLTQMSKSATDGPFVIGATNRMDTIDPAAIRPGRFNFSLELKYPDYIARAKILKSHLEGLPNTRVTETALKKVAEKTVGMSGAFLKGLVDRAVDLADYTYNDVTLDDKILLEALEQSNVHSIPSDLYKVIWPTEETNLDDVIVSSIVKREIDIFVKKIEKQGKSKQISVTGLLLSGPTGGGKTMLAHAIANKLGRPLVLVTAANLVSKWVGQSSVNINEIFKVARGIPESVIFFDEIDSMIPQRSYRDDGASHGYANMTNTFLTQMSESTTQGPFVMGATNRKEVIDPAAIRPGRFDTIIDIPYPSHMERHKILEVHLAKHGEHAISSNTMQLIADKTYATSGAFIKGLVDRARDILDYTDGADMISDDIILQALEQSILQEEKRSSTFTPHLRALSFSDLSISKRSRDMLTAETHMYKTEHYNPRILLDNQNQLPALRIAHAFAKEAGVELVEAKLSSLPELELAFSKVRSMDKAILFINNLEKVLTQPELANELEDYLERLNPHRRIVVLSAIKEGAQLLPNLIRRHFTVNIKLEQPKFTAKDVRQKDIPQSSSIDLNEYLQRNFKDWASNLANFANRGKLKSFIDNASAEYRRVAHTFSPGDARMFVRQQTKQVLEDVLLTPAWLMNRKHEVLGRISHLSAERRADLDRKFLAKVEKAFKSEYAQALKTLGLQDDGMRKLTTAQLTPVVTMLAQLNREQELQAQQAVVRKILDLDLPWPSFEKYKEKTAKQLTEGLIAQHNLAQQRLAEKFKNERDQRFEILQKIKHHGMHLTVDALEEIVGAPIDRTTIEREAKDRSIARALDRAQDKMGVQLKAEGMFN